MKTFILLLCLTTSMVYAEIPVRYTELVTYVQAAPDQGETNTCWFMASTGAVELLLNKKFKIKKPRKNGTYDLSESYLIWQTDYKDRKNPPKHFVEEMVKRFNYGEAVLNKHWPFKARNKDGTVNDAVWEKHAKFESLPRVKIPPIKTELIFAKGNKWDTDVLEADDLVTVKKALLRYKSPVIINYNDDDYWHVILIVGYDDKLKGVCYELTTKECNKKGSFIVRDSDGKRVEARAYNWFLKKVNAAAVIRFKD